MTTSWSDFERAAPELAARVRARFASNLHHIVGTVRLDGAPRLSGTEVMIDDGQISLGMMPSSRKLADVTRDARVEIHSAPLEDDLVAGDAKLSGRLRRSGDVGDQEGTMLALDIERVSMVRVDRDELEFHTWERGVGERVTRRR